MFLHLLNKAQQQCFCNVVRFIMTADGVVNESEHRLLQVAQREMGLDDLPAPVTSLALLATQLNAFDSPMARNILIFESVIAAMADGEIPESEMNILHELCKCLHIGCDRIPRFIKIAGAANKIFSEAQALIFEDYN